jgi:formylglycine-generating enzyme required for sulfatase activity
MTALFHPVICPVFPQESSQEENKEMKKLLAVIAILIIVIGLAGCGGGTGPAPSGEGSDAGETGGSAQSADTPTPIVLATPTPKPAPPTPTPRPSPTAAPPVAPAEAETSEGSEEAEAEPTEPAPPPVTDIMIEIPAGTFTMGSDEGDAEDQPAHEVDLPAYEIDQFEVTNADFAVFAEQTGYETYAEKNGYSSWRDEWVEGEKDNHAVVAVTWDDANAYCEWLGKRLPTEAEWEKAARGDDGRSFPWGNDWDAAKANVKETGLRGTVAGGSFGEGASPYGVDDMVGNVWEWTADWYQPYPGNTTEDAYYGEQFRVTRGGGWFDEEAQATVFNRNAADPAKTANDDLGFRCAR